MQVENEYGSFGSDHAYMEQIHRDLVDAGFDKAMLYTADNPQHIPNGSLPELPAVINFSPGHARQAFAALQKLRPNGPMHGGRVVGRLVRFLGRPAPQPPTPAQAEELEWILAQGYSISIYMFHGGTSFGWMNGANMDKTPYGPT